MPTPSIQTLVTDAQQVLNLDSISAVRSVVAVALANANVGTPLNPNLTTQQLWNEFYQVITKPKSDIESIIANQLMKFLFAPPAPGGVGADKQVIFNDNGVLAGDPQLLWDKTTNLLTVTGAATITGDLTVDTNTLFVDAANNRVGIGTASPTSDLDIFRLSGSGITSGISLRTAAGAGGDGSFIKWLSGGSNEKVAQIDGVLNGTDVGYLSFQCGNGADAMAEQYRIASSGLFTWYDGAGGTRMTLNSTGLGVGASPLGTAAGRGNVTINGSTDAILALGNAGVLTGYVAQSTSGMDIVGVGATFVRIQTNGSARLLVDSAGNFIPTLQATAPSLGLNSQMVFNLTSNTNLRISVRGTDGTTRVANITLA